MEIFEGLFLYWPGFAFILCVNIFAQVLKNNFLTKQMRKKYPLLIWVKKVYPLLLLFLGVLPGVLLPGEIVPGISSVPSKIMFFMGCSALSIVGFDVFKQWAKNKLEVK